MNEQPALPPPASPASTGHGVAILCATVVILVALGAGGYLLKQELDRLANAEPVAPPEVTQALIDLRKQLDEQRADSATQLHALQGELTTLKEQQEANTPPDVDAAIAPVQEKLDALVAKLEEAPVAVIPVVQETPAVTAPAEAVAPKNALRDYLSLRRKVESGQPYAAALAALIPNVPDSELDAITTLQAHAENGIGAEDEETEAPTTELKPWMVTLNDRMKGLLSIKPSAAVEVTPQARASVFAALDRIEASLMSEK